tara:strand:- start:240 stop:779 length:540 start_codon:yes stop_codon:yes gene_type:complete
MKRIYCNPFLLIFLCFILSSESVVYAQNSIDFSFEKTGPNHSVLVLPVWHPVIKELQQLDSIPADMVLGFDGDSLETGDKVGVFYLDNQENYKCAGSLEWKSNDFNMLPVWGQYPPGTDNGMEIGERMVWMAQKRDQSIYEIEATYQRPLMAIYLKDGASAVLGMKLSKRSDLKPLSPL